jgi:hypothetical protein
MAQPRQDTNVPMPTNNIAWGPENKRPYGYGAVAHPPASWRARAVTFPRIIDCVHVTFPQCSDGG